MEKKRKKYLFLALKLVVAAALLAWVLSKASWNDYVISKDDKTYTVVSVEPNRQAPQYVVVAQGSLWNRTEQQLPIGQLKTVQSKSQGVEYIRPGFVNSLKRMQVALLICALLGFLASNLVVAVRWWFLLRIQEIHISLYEALRLTFLGIFFNAIMPSTVGGDLVKAYYVSKHTPRKAAVLVSIFVDRILGLTELTVLAGAMILVVLIGGLEPFERIRNSAVTVAVVIAIVIGAMTFLLSARFRRLFRLEKIYQRLPIAHHIAAAGDAADLYRKRLPALVKAICMTFGAHVLWVGSIALLGLSLHLDTPWYNYFVYIPLIYIIGALPITLGGVGLIEQLYVGFFASMTMGASEILALALLARLVPMVWALPGILVAVTGPKLPRAAVMEAELADADTPPSQAGTAK